MRTRVQRQVLLDILKKNREAHHGIFLEAIDGYKRQWIEALEAELERVTTKSGKPKTYISLTQPMDHTQEYDDIIGLLEMSEDDTIDLDESNYRQYVKDDWGWKGQFLASNSGYSLTAAAMAASAGLNEDNQ